MKKLFKEQKVSLYRVQKDLNLDIKRLYRYADGTCNVKSMPLGLLKALSLYFEMGMYELYVAMNDYQEANRK